NRNASDNDNQLRQPAIDTNLYNVFIPREKAHRLHKQRVNAKTENNVQSFEMLRQVQENENICKLLLWIIKELILEAKLKGTGSWATFVDSIHENYSRDCISTKLYGILIRAIMARHIFAYKNEDFINGQIDNHALANMAFIPVSRGPENWAREFANERLHHGPVDDRWAD
ncbi:hypothetical protein Tco_0163126, partial [Tanacetum coccineum]